jgi:hypothetical protein
MVNFDACHMKIYAQFSAFTLEFRPKTPLATPHFQNSEHISRDECQHFPAWAL